MRKAVQELKELDDRIASAEDAIEKGNKLGTWAARSKPIKDGTEVRYTLTVHAADSVLKPQKKDIQTSQEAGVGEAVVPTPVPLLRPEPLPEADPEPAPKARRREDEDEDETPDTRPAPPPQVAAPWVGHVTLACAAAALVVAVLVLLRGGSKDAAQPDLHGELAKLSSQVEGEQASVRQLAQAVQASGPPKVQLPDGFAADIASKVAVPKTAKLDPAQVTALTAEIQKHGRVLTPEESANLVKAVQKAVQDAAPAGAAPRHPGEPNDVLVVVTHGAAMDANAYLPALRDVVVKRARGKGQHTRVGLAVARTNNVDVPVPPDEAKATLDGFGPPAREDSEEPALFGGKAKKAFTHDRGRERVILVASAGCDPVPPNTQGWTDMTEVHVVLVAQKELGPADQARLAKWYEFADALRGSVHLIGSPGNLDRQNESLRTCLKRLIGE